MARWEKMRNRVGPVPCRWCENYGCLEIQNTGRDRAVQRCTNCNAEWVVVPSQGYRIVSFVRVPDVRLPEWAAKWITTATGAQ